MIDLRSPYASQWPPWKIAEETSKLKARLGERWEEETCKAITGRHGSMLETLSYVFSAGRNAECSFIQWLDREALLAYIYFNPCDKQQVEDVNECDS